ncbi:MAG: ribonuclease III [Rhizobiales bacterium NRL2]|jgi:ribonuclease-3|nr:MAG: ribonuclease III [Rhizobiales bacterium NRL2]
MAELERALGHAFADRGRLQEALTHPSALQRGRAERGDYERLEFLGDRVLGLVIAMAIFREYPDANAGHMARRYNEMVRKETLAEVALETGLAGYIRMSPGERETGGLEKPAILADICEAVIGALYLDGGLPAAERFIGERWRVRIAGLEKAPKDSKTALQEWAHAHGIEPPEYELVAARGPDHAPEFTVRARFARGEAEATGSSKKVAERRAAETLLGKVENGRDG